LRIWPSLHNNKRNREREDRPLPKYVVKEFEAFLACGIPAYGFLRLACNTCKEEKIAAFSCKKRGFCPSCCAKRQAEAASHLVENVLPITAYRQFVVTFPIPLRYWMHANKELFAKVYGTVIKEIHKYYVGKAIAVGIKNPKAGAISFTQLAGSALALNPHLHILCCDGVFQERKNGEALRFRNLPTITDQEVEKLLIAISAKVLKHLGKRGYLDEHGEMVNLAPHCQNENRIFVCGPGFCCVCSAERVSNGGDLSRRFRRASLYR
jgi:Transposase zinc-binding domain/Putative transposase